MNTLVFASTRKSAGKTSLIVGMARNLKDKCGYMKPFGDRLLYRKKRLWDYDAALAVRLFGLDDNPEHITLGFEHSKLRYMYDRATTLEKLGAAAGKAGRGVSTLFVEAGCDLSYGASVHLDALTVAKALGGKLVLVLSGTDDTMVDDVAFFKSRVASEGVELAGVIVNKVRDVEDFTATHKGAIDALGVTILGILPYAGELTNPSMSYLVEALFAKVIAGEGGLNKVVRSIFVGAMSADAALRNPQFNKNEKLIVTSGDRSDMILAALESDSVGIILTNNILPPPNVITHAQQHNIPLLLVSSDTFQTAKQLDDMDPLLTKDDSAKIDILAGLVKSHISLKALVA